MNTETKAQQIAAQVAHKQVKAFGNRINIHLTRDPFDREAFAAWKELIAQVQDALPVYAKDWVWSRGGGAEMRSRGRVVEVYNSQVEIVG